jgi:hypothetical protein
MGFSKMGAQKVQAGSSVLANTTQVMWAAPAARSSAELEKKRGV